MATTLHVIPHAHWDREWYMSFEQHRMKLVELLDTLIETMEQNPAYTYYHLDGQTIVLEDYLEIRPQMRERLLRLVRDDRIQVGPWYVLQDEFLTSGEANVRNMLTGLRQCRELGARPVMSGYFPDAFGNISQAPQILRGFGIDNAVFGRGVSETQYDNQIVEGKTPNPSEWRWRSPDGSEVIGVMFAHWYHNAMELPAGRDALKKRLDALLESTAASAATPHLLGMNGCDHQPVQTDLPAVLQTAGELYDGQSVTIVQSNFKEYVQAIRPYVQSFPVCSGELNGQRTSGYGLLVNTASTHVPLKQKNHACQNALEQQAEPLNTLSWLMGDAYRIDFLRYAWKTLMQNHPHDSICCCSVDEVTREMNTRFDKAGQVARGIADGAAAHIAGRLDTSSLEEYNLTVFHTGAGTDTAVVSAYLDVDEQEETTQWHVVDEDGRPVPCAVTPLGRTFTFSLPRDRFRQVTFVNRYRIELPVTMSGAGYRTYPVRRGAAPSAAGLQVAENGAQSGTLAFTIHPDGSLSLTDKRSGRRFDGLNIFEDGGDRGDSYNYIPADAPPVTTAGGTARIRLAERTDFSATFEIRVFLEPVGEIVTLVTLTEGVDRLDIQTQVDNQAENHRLRALFGAGIRTDHVLADEPFDVVEREIVPWEGWTNPSNCRRCQAFFALDNDEEGLLIATRGQQEYEILRDGKNTMALTLLRCVGAVGDWGVFPTPDMQCKGSHTFSYAIVPYGAGDRESAFDWGYGFHGDSFAARMVRRQTGTRPAQAVLFRLEGAYIRLSALKKCEDRESALLRLYNVDGSVRQATLHLPDGARAVYRTNLAEEREEELPLDGGVLRLDIPAKKIVTLECVIEK